MAECIISVGSNLGDRKKFLRKATELIIERAGKITRASSLYETEAWGFEATNKFLNQAIIIETDLRPENLLRGLLDIEKMLGRERSKSGYESRVIDIDILFYDNLIINTENLVIPHPRIGERMFVIKPLLEIAEDHIHPISGKSIRELFLSCNDSKAVHIMPK